MKTLLSTLLVTAAAAALACTTTGDRPPRSSADAPAAATDPAPAPAPAVEAVPDNSSRTAVRPAPRQEAGPKPPPPEPVVEIRWEIDPAIPDPEELEDSRILAKFRAPDGAVIVVYEKADGTVIRRRIRGMADSDMMLVEEKVIEERPPGS